MNRQWKPDFQLAQVIRDKQGELAENGKLNSHQKGILTNMSNCRTPNMGGQMMACKHCGAIHYHFHSCRNRHCNLCGGMKRDKWAMDRKNDMLPVKYLHIVFTLPHQLNGICLKNQKAMFNLLMQTAWQTIQLFANDHKHLGGKMGAVMVLHTWGQNLSYHPHVHCLVPAGGITKQGKWRNVKSNGKFFAPVKQMGKVFRGKFTDGIARLQEQGCIEMEEPICKEMKHLHPLYKNNWVVYAKKPMTTGEKVIEYISRYVHRVAISNSRIKNYDGKTVSFSWFDYRSSKKQVTSMEAMGFLQRFALHILPKGFAKVRHYGILACRNKTDALTQIRKQLGYAKGKKENTTNWQLRYEKLYGTNPMLCKHCRKGYMVLIKELPRIRDGPVQMALENRLW